MSTFLPAMWPAFFIRVRPASRKAKPACMNMTRTAVTTTQTVETAISSSWLLGTDLRLLQPPARAVVHHVLDPRGPDEAVARLVAAPRGIDDRVDDELLQPVLDDEDEERLRQEPRLEDAPAVLVRHAALPAVTDRLDHRHADVARRFLDRVDHRLHPFPDHRRLHLDHPLLLRSRTKKRPRKRASIRAPEASMPPPAAVADGRSPEHYTK